MISPFTYSFVTVHDENIEFNDEDPHISGNSNSLTFSYNRNLVVSALTHHHTILVVMKVKSLSADRVIFSLIVLCVNFNIRFSLFQSVMLEGCTRVKSNKTADLRPGWALLL